MHDPLPIPTVRTRSLVRTVALVALVWLAAGGAALLTVSDTTLGPVLLTFSRGHGIHLGDVLVLPWLVAAATVATRLVLRR